MSKERASAALDGDSKAMIYEGCSIGQLAVIFKMDKRDVTAKLGTMPPAAHRGGYPVYHIRDAARKMWKPDAEELEQIIRNLSHHDLPKILTKEFWAGLRSKQEYELRAGQLWPTAVVVEKASELYKLVKMSVLLLQDAVERETELTEKQREIIVTLAHGMLEDLATQIAKHFSNPEPAVIQSEEETSDDEL